MKQFLGGFLAASIVWVGMLYAQSVGWLEIFGTDEAVEVMRAADAGTQEIAAETADKKDTKRKKRRRPRKRGPKSHRGAAYTESDGIAGDDLGGVGGHELSMAEAGGQEQLSAAQIDRGIDQVFNGIQRCLVLVPPDLPAIGKIVLGMHITSSGRVTKVNLKGPNPIVQGECGVCIRRQAKSIRYSSFNGPDMVVHYPIVFD